MAGLLLDTNALIWLLSGEPMAEAALFAIAEAQGEKQLFVSPISAWEAALAQQKPNPERRPNLNGADAAEWFRRGRRNIGARLATISQAIALEAARVPAIYGNGDPGDCFLIATARVRQLALVTRDRLIGELADREPGYLAVIRC